MNVQLSQKFMRLQKKQPAAATCTNAYGSTLTLKLMNNQENARKHKGPQMMRKIYRKSERGVNRVCVSALKKRRKKIN